MSFYVRKACLKRNPVNDLLEGIAIQESASRLLGQIVYQANPRDPVVVGGAVLTMALLGISASAIPALRALNSCGKSEQVKSKAC
jgi:hypothetical protein